MMVIRKLLSIVYIHLPRDEDVPKMSNSIMEKMRHKHFVQTKVYLGVSI